MTSLRGGALQAVVQGPAQTVIGETTGDDLTNAGVIQTADRRVEVGGRIGEIS
jgi:hypothetical protein